MRRALHGHHPRGAQDASREVARRGADAARDLQGAGRLRDRPGARQEGALGRGAQPLQAAGARPEEQRRRDRQVEYPAARPHGVRQDAAGADAGAHPRRAVHHGRRHHADRGRLRRRGCREHHPQAAAIGRLQRRAGAARHRLHRRGRQDQPQVRQPLDHPRRQRRGRAAGAAEDHGGHRRLGAAAGRAQASAAGVPAGRHHQHPVHLRRRVLGAGADHLGPRQGLGHRLRRRGARRRPSGGWARCCARSNPRTC